MKTIWDSFALRAESTPAAAAICGEASYSYRELAEQAAALAQAIRRHGRPGAVIALDATGPVAGAVAFLAAAQARCAILPLSAESPPGYRSLILADAGAGLVLREVDGHALTVAPADRGSAGQAEASTRWPSALSDVAYVIYTSGSTGRPKGVVVSHDALLSRLRALAAVPGLRAGESFLAMTALSFDICLAEMLLPLTVGGRVVAAPTAARLDPETFAEVVREHRPDVIQATPSFWRLALAWGWRGAPSSRLWCGGEQLTPSLAAKMLMAGAELWNLYGPTEATIWASAARVTSPDRISLGNPLPGAGMCLEGDDGSLVSSHHQPGEILLYGDGLAVGYLNQPDLTGQRFCARRTPEGPRRCYRTGDRGQYRDDGQLEFLGRDDCQVKLRGHRIELGEVEAVLEQHPAVHQAVVVLRAGDSAEHAHIAAFLVGDDHVTGRQLRAWLADRLPPSMRPGRISFLRAMPRTAAGKVDRVSLATGAHDNHARQSGTVRQRTAEAGPATASARDSRHAPPTGSVR